MFKRIPARASTLCPRRFRVSRTISRKSNPASANSTSSSSISRIPCKASTLRFPELLPLRPPAPPLPPPPPGAPSADTLYSNGLRDITSGKYDLARSEFQDYLKYYAETDLASNAQFYLGEIAYSQKNLELAVAEYEKVLNNYPKSSKLAPARLKKGMALIDLGQKTGGVRELREVVKRYPGTDEDRRARAKLKELGVPITATR